MNWSVEIDESSTLIISEEISGLEIVIHDFDSRKAITDTLPQCFLGELTQLGVAYPLGGPTEPQTYLQLSITGNGERWLAKLRYGDNVSWELPSEFAENLLILLLAGCKAVS